MTYRSILALSLLLAVAGDTVGMLLSESSWGNLVLLSEIAAIGVLSALVARGGANLGRALLPLGIFMMVRLGSAAIMRGLGFVEFPHDFTDNDRRDAALGYLLAMAIYFFLALFSTLIGFLLARRDVAPTKGRNGDSG